LYYIAFLSYCMELCLAIWLLDVLDNVMTQTHFFSSADDVHIVSVFTTWKTENPAGGGLLFLAESELDAIPRLQVLAKEAGLPIIGAVFPALISSYAFQSQGLLFIGLSKFPQHSILPLDTTEAMSTAVRRVNEMCRDSGGGQDALCLIFDAMVPNIASILDHMYLAVGRKVNYLGCNAGSESFQPMPCLFDSSSRFDNAVLAILFESHPGAVMEHGYQQPDRLTAATSTTGNRISTIDWRPAFEVYQELADKHYQQIITRENFYQMGAHFPLGVLRADGSVLVRIPVAVEDDGSLFCVGEVPENSVLTLLEAVSLDESDSVEVVSERMTKAGMLQNSSEFVLAFYCAGRRMHMGDDNASAELALLKASIPGKTHVGVVSLGEIGSFTPTGYPLFHNATIVLSPGKV